MSCSHKDILHSELNSCT